MVDDAAVQGRRGVASRCHAAHWALEHLKKALHLKEVRNAKPERDSTEIEIFGMQGIPWLLLLLTDRQAIRGGGDARRTSCRSPAWGCCYRQSTWSCCRRLPSTIFWICCRLGRPRAPAAGHQSSMLLPATSPTNCCRFLDNMHQECLHEGWRGLLLGTSLGGGQSCVTSFVSRMNDMHSDVDATWSWVVLILYVELLLGIDIIFDPNQLIAEVSVWRRIFFCVTD